MANQPFVGRLDPFALPGIIRELYIQHASGTLNLQHDKEQCQLFFREGDILSARSNRMGTALVSVLNREGFDLAGGGTDVGSAIRAFMEEGRLTKEKLGEIMRDSVREIIFALFSWKEGLFEFDPSKCNPGDSPQIHVTTADLIFYGVKNTASSAMIEHVLKDRSIPLVPNPSIRLLFQHVTLDPKEVNLLSSVDGSRTCDDLLQNHPGLERSLAALIASGVVSTHDEMPLQSLDEVFARYAERRPDSVQKRRRKRLTRWIRTKSPEVEFTEKDVRLMRDRIVEKAKILDRLNYYQLLECPIRATQKEIHFAFINLGSFYHPDLALKREFSDLKPQLEAIFQKLEEAYFVLVDHNQRVQYDQRMKYLL